MSECRYESVVGDQAVRVCVVHAPGVALYDTELCPFDGGHRRLPDADALDQIAEILRDPEWGVGMLEDIGDIARSAGRSIENYPDERSTWERH
jgi:hypothetical protein